jgi:predicted TIM-barrel fold metal-dependent hydrolase
MIARSAAAVRVRLDHPVIDADGHVIEFVPAAMDHLRELAGSGAVDTLWELFRSGSSLLRGQSIEARRRTGLARMTWWAYPAQNTLDRATGMLPALLHRRLDELGIDFAVLYPTAGGVGQTLDDAELRQAVCRAFNRYYAEEYGPYRDRLTVAALIPMYDPAEAIRELDYAVGELGFKSALLSGYVARPLPGENSHRWARWLDNFVLDSPYDYDPFWQRMVELGVVPVFHPVGMGWGGRVSVTSYVFNHIGNFAAGNDNICRALFLSGVLGRFPSLRFAFLEGGVGWACSLYAELIGHWEKRNRDRIGSYDPSRIDRRRVEELFRRHGSSRFQRHLGEIEPALRVLADPDEDPTALDEFASCKIQRPEDIRHLFDEHFHFGCEADDPLAGAAFDRARNPLGARLRAVLGSDIGHWDVPEMSGILAEAWELVETKRLSERDFRDFAFANTVHLYTGANPEFFRGTAVESAAARERDAGG